MKLPSLIQSLAIIAAARGALQNATGFYAKIDESFIRLVSYSEIENELSVFEFAQESSPPTKVVFQEESPSSKGSAAFAAFADDPNAAGPVGFDGKRLGFGPRVECFNFSLNSDKKVLDKNFYACLLPSKDPHCFIMALEHDQDLSSADIRPEEECKPVEIYALAFDKDTGARLEGPRAPEASGPKAKPSSPTAARSKSGPPEQLDPPGPVSVPSDNNTHESETRKTPGPRIKGTSIPALSPTNSSSLGLEPALIADNCTAVICKDTTATSVHTFWRTHTDYTTYCPEETTVTLTVCAEVCQHTEVAVTTATTLTFSGVCIVPETAVVNKTLSQAPQETGRAVESSGPSAMAGEAHKESKGKPALNGAGAVPKPSGAGSKPKHIEVDHHTRNRTAIVTAPSDTLFVNGAFQPTIHAWALGVAALLL